LLMDYIVFSMTYLLSLLGANNLYESQ